MTDPTYYNIEALKDTAKYPVKDISQKRNGGTLENWELIDCWNGNTVCIGTLVGDSNWDDGEIVQTSMVVSVNGKTLETLYTVYQLGTPKYPH